MSHWETLTLLQSQDQQIEEFRKKYMGTYVWLQQNSSSNNKTLVYFSDADGDFFYFTDEFENGYRVRYDTDSVISAYFPRTKLINFNGKFLLFSRVPARQYRKAPCIDNVIITNPLRYSCGLDGSISLGINVLKEVYNPTYYDWNFAVDYLKQDKVTGVAIDSQFALSLHPNTDDKLLLWIYDYPVAEYDKNNTIYVKVTEFEQEILDFTKKYNLPLVTKV